MPRNAKARLKRLALLPKNRVKAPASQEEAEELLKDVAAHLSRLPNASPRFRYVALVMKKDLRSNGQLSHDMASALVPRRGVPKRPGNQPIPPETVRAIAKMLAVGADVPTIMKSCAVKKTTTDRVKTEYRALFYTAPDSWRKEDGDIPEHLWKEIVRRARTIDPPEWRDPIIRGVRDGLCSEDFIDAIDPTNPFAPQPVDPAHKPDVVRGKKQLRREEAQLQRTSTQKINKQLEQRWKEWHEQRQRDLAIVGWTSSELSGWLTWRLSLK